jgi:hypothetical protein
MIVTFLGILFPEMGIFFPYSYAKKTQKNKIFPKMGISVSKCD